jgi:transposase-like protein
VRRRQGCVGDAPHQDEQTFEASTDSDISVQEDSSTNCRGDSPAHPPDRAGGDGFALSSIAPAMPCWEHLIAVGDEHPPTAAPARPASVAQEISADRVPAEAIPAELPRRGYDRQADRRQQECELRKQALAFRHQANADGWSTAETAEVLGIAPRTLWYWNQHWQTDNRAACPRGRPPRIASTERQAAVAGFLETYGPYVSLATLRAEHPDIARAELAGLRVEYRTEWRLQHAREQCQLEWLCPGSVWAMDFTHPPHRIDGAFPTILNVLDLASHQQLLWLAVEHEDAATVVEALGALFAEHGAPLVMKCDNGPAFRAHVTKRILLDAEVFTLYSPPYCARYNGACERANRALKELTAHVAEQNGRADFWVSDDLLLARLRANRLSRPWGAAGTTPEESWTARGILSLDKRKNMWQQLKSGIAAVLDEREIDPMVALPHYTQSEIERIAAPPVLEQLGLLHVTRRRIAPVF